MNSKEPLFNKLVRQRPIDPQIVEDLLKVIDVLMPGIGGLALQDYKTINDAPLKAREWLKEVR